LCPHPAAFCCPHLGEIWMALHENSSIETTLSSSKIIEAEVIGLKIKLGVDFRKKFGHKNPFIQLDYKTIKH
jgi:hypothetical protein